LGWKPQKVFDKEIQNIVYDYENRFIW